MVYQTNGLAPPPLTRTSKVPPALPDPPTWNGCASLATSELSVGSTPSSVGNTVSTAMPELDLRMLAVLSDVPTAFPIVRPPEGCAGSVASRLPLLIVNTLVLLANHFAIS